jgi:hypothetical protein
MAEKVGNLADWEHQRDKADKMAEAADWVLNANNPTDRNKARTHLRESLDEYRQERSRQDG